MFTEEKAQETKNPLKVATKDHQLPTKLLSQLKPTPSINSFPLKVQDSRIKRNTYHNLKKVRPVEL